MKGGLKALASLVPLLFAGFVFALPADAATLNAGDLVKLPDDGNPATSHDTSVYYYGADGKRYVFPNDKTYFTWYVGFGAVKEIDAATMASLPLGGNVTYRPGVRMLKIQSDPKVYAVAGNGTLRPIKDEAAAVSLYGADWNTKIDDISDAFFINYRFGAEVSSVIDFDPSTAMSAAYTIGVDRGLSSEQDFPTSDDEPNLTVTALPLPSSGPFVAGTENVTLGIFRLKGATTGMNAVSRIRFQAYIDEREGVAGFGEHLDNDDGTPTFAHAVLGDVGLYDADGNVLSSPRGLDSGSALDFSGLAISIPPGQTLDIHLKGKIADDFDAGSASDLLAFDIRTPQTDIVVSGITVTGSSPNGGASPTHHVELVSSGSMDLEWKGESGTIVAGREVLLGRLTAEVQGEDFTLEQVTLRTLGQLKSIASYRLSYLKPDDTFQDATLPYLGNQTTFSGLDFGFIQGRVNEVLVYAQLKNAHDDFYGERVQVDILSTDPMAFRSTEGIADYDETAFITDPTAFTFTHFLSDQYVRFSEIRFSRLSGSPSGTVGRSGTAEVLRFRIEAPVEGGLRVTKLTFKLEPDDMATSGGNNDALEGWARLNGDGPDDNDVVSLYQFSPNVEDPLGEDASARLRYYIVDDGTRDDTPSDVVSSAKDYGLIVYEFVQDQEIKVPAGSVRDFRLEVDTREFAIGTHGLKVSILGGNDLAWTDRFQGNYTVITGEIGPGLPLEGHQLTVQ